MTAIPERGWLVDYDTAAEARMAFVLGVRRPRGSRTLKKPLTRYLRHPRPDPWSFTTMADQEGRTIDVGLDALLRHHGVDPDAMLLMSLLGAVPEMRHGVSGNDVSMMPKENATPHVRGIAWMAPGIVWDSIQGPPFIHMRGHGIPDTVAAGVDGRPLRALVTHPALDDLDIVVDHVVCTGDWTKVMLRDVPKLRVGPSWKTGKG